MAESKERVRVQAGRGGAPKTAGAGLPAVHVPQSALPVPRTLYEAIIAAARDSSVDADKMEKLVDLQIKVEVREAEKAFTRAFNALQFELPAIDKDGKIDHGSSPGSDTTRSGKKAIQARYSTYPNLMSVCRPLLKTHGFTFNNVIEPTADGSKIVVVGYLRHVDGHFMKSEFPIGMDQGPGRSNAQSWGSASSYGKRYNLILMLDIVSEAPQDQDDDKRRNVEMVPVSEDQVSQLNSAIEFCGVGVAKFCKKYGIENIADLPASKFNAALKACSSYAEENAKRPSPASQTSAEDD